MRQLNRRIAICALIILVCFVAFIFLAWWAEQPIKWYHALIISGSFLILMSTALIISMALSDAIVSRSYLRKHGVNKESIDFLKLIKALDEALNNETSESLTTWIKNKRKRNKTT